MRGDAQSQELDVFTVHLNMRTSEQCAVINNAFLYDLNNLTYGFPYLKTF